MVEHAERAGAPHRARLAAIDAAIVAVLVIALLSVVQVRRSLTSDDGAARAIAEWAQEGGATRLAWPPGERKAVPALLDAGVTPVLIDPGAPPLDYAVNDTPVVVVGRGDPAPEASTDTFDAGPFTAHRIDVGRAGRTPLAPGEQVGIEYSRPYRYAPIMPSLPVDLDNSPSIEMQLGPGRYLWGIEAMAPKAKGSLRARVSVDGTVTETDLKLEAAPSRDLQLGIPIVGDGLHQVILTFSTFATDGVPKPAVYVHSWTLQREAEG